MLGYVPPPDVTSGVGVRPPDAGISRAARVSDSIADPARGVVQGALFERARARGVTGAAVEGATEGANAAMGEYGVCAGRFGDKYGAVVVLYARAELAHAAGLSGFLVAGEEQGAGAFADLRGC